MFIVLCCSPIRRLNTSKNYVPTTWLIKNTSLKYIERVINPTAEPNSHVFWKNLKLSFFDSDVAVNQTISWFVRNRDAREIWTTMAVVCSFWLWTMLRKNELVLFIFNHQTSQLVSCPLVIKHGWKIPHLLRWSSKKSLWLMIGWWLNPIKSGISQLRGRFTVVDESHPTSGYFNPEGMMSPTANLDKTIGNWSLIESLSSYVLSCSYMFLQWNNEDMAVSGEEIVVDASGTADFHTRDH